MVWIVTLSDTREQIFVVSGSEKINPGLSRLAKTSPQAKKICGAGFILSREERKASEAVGKAAEEERKRDLEAIEENLILKGYIQDFPPVPPVIMLIQRDTGSAPS